MSRGRKIGVATLMTAIVLMCSVLLFNELVLGWRPVPVRGQITRPAPACVAPTYPLPTWASGDRGEVIGWLDGRVAVLSAKHVLQLRAAGHTVFVCWLCPPGTVTP